MGDDPFSEMSPWNASHEHSCRGHVFNLARIVAAAFEDVNFQIAPTGLVRIDGGSLLLLSISRSFTKTSVMRSPENEELAAFDLTTLCPDSTQAR
jgi:hypothetical protein